MSSVTLQTTALSNTGPGGRSLWDTTSKTNTIAIIDSADTAVCVDYNVNIFKALVASGTDMKKAGNWVKDTLTNYTYGSSTDLWGTTLTADDVNAFNFGVGVSAQGTGNITYQGVFYQAGFTIPPGSIINGVVFTIDKRFYYSSSAGKLYANLANPYITVYYTPMPAIKGVSSLTGVSSITL